MKTIFMPTDCHM